MTAVPEIFVTLGSCDDMRAEVYVRPAGHVPLGSTIAGSLTGPRRGRDTTLPATSRLMPLSDPAATGPASRAILTEPAFWTPDLPNLDRVEARLEPQGGDSWTTDAWIGLRRLGIRGRSFWLDGRRWVPRVVVGPRDLAAAKDAGMAAEDQMAVVDLIAANPQIGDIMPGCGGARKVRIARPGKGKSGGYRIITYYGGDDIPVFLLTVFGKNERANLTRAERNALAVLTKRLRDSL